MSVQRRLIRTPRPYRDESLKGLKLRATDENGYDSPSWLLSLANLREDGRTKRTIYTEQRWQNLSEMLNLEIPMLQDLACLLGIEEAPPQHYNMFGHVIHKYAVRISAPKICPGCLRQSNYIRKIWDLAAFTCCPEHGTLLLDECANCGKGISWGRGSVSVCSCGQDWRNLFPPEVHESEKILSRLILQICGFPQTEECSTDAIGEEAIAQGHTNCNPLRTVSLGELLSSVYFIAGLQHSVVDTTGKQYAIKLSHKELHEALTNAIVVFEDWPNNYYKFIDECRGKISTRSGETGLYKDFGKLYDPLFVKKGNPFPEFMREAFTKYITTRWDGGYAGWCSNVSAEEFKAKKYMTRHEVTKDLRVSLITVNRLHKGGFIRGQYLPWVNRSRIMIEADSVRELKERWAKAINAEQAGKMIGIGRIAVVSLVTAGCLAAIQGPAVTGQLERKFEVAEVEKLLKLVGGKILAKRQEPGNLTVGFHKAIQKLSKLSLEVGAFAKLILDGKLLPIAKGDGVGLASLLFDAAEIGRFSRAEAVKRRGTMRTMREATRLLHIKAEVVISLVKRGLLVAVKEAGGRGGTWAITQKEIDRFNATYSSVGQIVLALGTSTKGVAKRLIANGIKPISGPTVDGGVTYFFKRTDLEAVDLKVLLPKAQMSTMQKMNEEGLVSKRQFADMTKYPKERIDDFIRKGEILPVVTKQRKDGKGARPFFSQEQVEKFEELKAKEGYQLTIFDIPWINKGVAA